MLSRNEYRHFSSYILSRHTHTHTRTVVCLMTLPVLLKIALNVSIIHEKEIQNVKKSSSSLIEVLEGMRYITENLSQCGRRPDRCSNPELPE